MYELLLISVISLDFTLLEDRNPVYSGFHKILMVITESTQGRASIPAY